jgi:hypothetical protein
MILTQITREFGATIPSLPASIETHADQIPCFDWGFESTQAFRFFLKFSNRL